MRTLTFDEVVKAMGGRALGRPPASNISSICTDSRELAAGDLFFALPGDRFDGHDFVDAVLKQGAIAAVVADVNRVPQQWHDGGRLISVNDVVDALGRLAAYHRSQTAAHVIGVVGSNGKTTTKALIHAVLSSRKRGRAAPKSFNNHIGVPVTLLSVQSSDEYVVVEIGTNHPGEVARLAQLAEPDIGVVTSIGEEHLEFFGDVSQVAREELSLLRHIRPRGFVVMQEDCRLHPGHAQRDDLKRVFFGAEPGADLRATDVSYASGRATFRVNGRFDYSLPAFGLHNVSNALAAVAVGLRFGLSHEDIAAALATAELPPMRQQRVTIGGITIINDAYNANPSSMKAAIAAFEHVQEPGRRVLILGDMRELGEHSVRCHEELGRTVGRSSAAVVVAIGAYSRTVIDGVTATAGGSKRAYWYPSVEAAGEGIGPVVQPGDVVLMKGSRGMRLERLLTVMEQASASPSPA